jgi:hypothetical protein
MSKIGTIHQCLQEDPSGSIDVTIERHPLAGDLLTRSDIEVRELG